MNCKELFAILGLSNDLEAITSIACTPLACLSSFSESLFPAFATNRPVAPRFTAVHMPLATLAVDETTSTWIHRFPTPCGGKRDRERDGRLKRVRTVSSRRL